MSDEGQTGPRQILEPLLERHAKRETLASLDGLTIHAIERSRTFGKGGSLEGCLLVEDKAGNLRRIDGKQLAQLNETSPAFLRYWRLEE